MFDKKVLRCFLDKQLQLFPEEVANSEDEALEFLEESFATVLNSEDEVIEYFEEEGLDYDPEDILSACEVFEVGDGRYLVIEA